MPPPNLLKYDREDWYYYHTGSSKEASVDAEALRPERLLQRIAHTRDHHSAIDVAAEDRRRHRGGRGGRLLALAKVEDLQLVGHERPVGEWRHGLGDAQPRVGAEPLQVDVVSAAERVGGELPLERAKLDQRVSLGSVLV